MSSLAEQRKAARREERREATIEARGSQRRSQRQAAAEQRKAARREERREATIEARGSRRRSRRRAAGNGDGDDDGAADGGTHRDSRESGEDSGEVSVLDDGEDDPLRGSASTYPEWSWDRVRTYAALRNEVAFSDKDIEALARQDTVMIEKTTGWRTFGSVEKGTLDAGRRIKTINPKAKVLFYLNSMVHYPHYDSNAGFKEEWAMRKADGEHFKWRNKHLSYNHTNLEFREWWIRRALDISEHDEVDGIFIDGIVKTDLRFLPVEGHGEAYLETANELRSRLKGGKILIGNGLRASARHSRDGYARHLRYLDGSYLENWAKPPSLKPTLKLCLAAVKQGRIIMLNAGPTIGEDEWNALDLAEDEWDALDLTEDERYERMGRPKLIGFPLGYFLLFAGRHSHLSYHMGVAITKRERALFDNTRFEAIMRKLGEPLGDCEERGGGIYAREFEHLKVEVDFENLTGTLTVKGGAGEEL